MRIDVETYQRVLGDELRKVRKRRGWTRKELNQKLQTDISLQTLATYELGTRQCSVVRLAEICLAMNEPPHEVLARVHARLFGSTPTQVHVNLLAVAEDTQPELAPLRRWAQDRLLKQQNGGHEVHLDVSAIERMAELCGVAPADLVDRIRKLSAG